MQTVKNIKTPVSKYVVHKSCYFPRETAFEIMRLKNKQLTKKEQVYFDKLLHKLAVMQNTKKLKKSKIIA
jgi:hypothetical protein